MKWSRDRFREGFVLVAAIQGGGFLLAYAANVALARWLGLEGFGAYAHAFALASSLAILLPLGLGSAAMRVIPDARGRSDWPVYWGFRRFSANVYLGASATIVTLAAVGHGLGARWPSSEVAIVLLAVWAVPLAGLSWLRFLMRSDGFVVASQLPRGVLYPAGLLVATILAITTDWAASPVRAVAIGSSVGLACMAVQAPVAWLRTAAAPAARHASKPREWLGVAWPMLGDEAVGVLALQGGVLVAGIVATSVATARLAAAAQLALLVASLLMVLNTIAAPQYSRLLAQGRTQDLAALVSRTVRWMFLPSVVLCVVLAAAAVPLLDLFGPGFSRARLALWILLAGQLANAAAGPAGNLLKFTGHQRLVFVVGAGASLAFLGTAWLGGTFYGAPGVAAAVASSMAGKNGVFWWFCRRRLGIDPSVIGWFNRPALAKVAPGPPAR